MIPPGVCNTHLVPTFCLLRVYWHGKISENRSIDMFEGEFLEDEYQLSLEFRIKFYQMVRIMESVEGMVGAVDGRYRGWWAWCG